jgi:predicted MPP superfamily phosphohydrolase
MGRLFRLLLVALLLAGGLAGYGYWEETRRPIVRQASLALPGWPAGAPPLRVVLFSDLHVGGPDMPPERVARIVAQVNALAPDVVLIAGDFITEKRLSTRLYAYPEALAPLAALRPRLATVAVLGNHDHWRDAAAARLALTTNGVTVLDNQAVQIGPLVVGGLDDSFTHHEDVPATLAAMRRLRGARILLSHDPDPFAGLPPDIPLMVAGHTHCGQVALPFYGAVRTMSQYGRRYACGRVEEGGKILFVTAGLGTSGVPVRIGAPPDLWLLTLGAKSAAVR